MNLSFGYRTLDEVARFLYVSKKYYGTKFEWQKCLDMQILQKILPKIHGGPEIDKSLGELSEKLKTAGCKESANKIDMMVKVLESRKYTTFNC